MMSANVKSVASQRKGWSLRPCLFLSVLLVTLTACSGGGDAAIEAPVAAGLVVGQGVSSDPDQPLIEVTVRSGSELVLNGENSDGTRFPIDTAVWTQTDSSGITVQLDKRTEFSRAVQIPHVVTPLTLSFELSVTNTDGDNSVTPVTINVVPVGDRDRFLEFFSGVAGEYTVVAALKPGMSVINDTPFTVSQRRFANYIDRSGTPRSMQSIGAVETRSSSWLGGTSADYATTVEGIDAFTNPNLVFALPRVDIDDINVHFDDTNPDQGIAEHRRDTVEQYVQLTLDVPVDGCVDAANNAVDCSEAAILHVLNANGVAAPVTELTSDLQVLVAVEDIAASARASGRANVTQPESAASAKAYYRAVDPFDRRLTLADWLQNAEMEDASGNPSADSDNVLYINNYDLGFTRDMTLRRDANTGEVFAYVTNYPALRPAVLDSDVLATVAMEYGPPDQDESAPQSQWLVKFFVFVPDEEGVQHRVNSLNFDGRGEKWVPGSCMPCHGGELRDLDSEGNFPENGDVNAAFLPWDLDSFLFVAAEGHPTLVDPLVTEGFKVNRNYLQPEDLQQFSLAAQQDKFRRMNEAVLSTMKEDDGESTRFGLVRRQIHGWYGNCPKDDGDMGACAAAAESDELPEVDYNDRAYIQAGWEEAGLEDVYFEVFARHCRVCHSQAKGINQFVEFEDLTRGAMRERVRRYLYEDGVMPNARLDMDRFWVDFHGAEVTPATRLGEALGFAPEEMTPPGSPIARIRGAAIQTAMPQAIQTDVIDSQPIVADGVKNQEGIRFDGSISSFAETYSWEFTSRPPGSTAQLIGADTAKPAFMIDTAGEYRVALTTSNASGTSEPTQVIVRAGPGEPKETNATYSATLPEATPDRPSSVIISSNMLDWFDADTTDENLVYTVTTAPTLGTLAPGTTFTQAQVNAGEVSYTQIFDREGIQDSFVYTIGDGLPENNIPDQTFTLNISLLNDEPFQVNDGDLLIAAAATAPIGTNLLQWNDVEGDVRYTITRPTLFGELLLSGTPLLAGGEFSQNDIDNGALAYVHTSSAPNEADSFDYTVSDASIVNTNNTFEIAINFPTVAPALLVSDLSTPVASERRITAAVAAVDIPVADLAVLDQDTSDPNALTFSLVSAPAQGNLVIRGTAPRTLSDSVPANSTFTLAEVATANGTDGLFYVSDLLLTDSASTDSFVVSISDATETGTCSNVGATGANCTVQIALTARNEGPSGSSNPLTLGGLINPLVARSGNTVSSEDVNQVPWADVMLTANAGNLPDASRSLDFVDVITGDPGEIPLQYRVLTAPTRGVLKRSGAPLLGNTSRIINAGDVFSHAEVLSNNIFYENRTVSDASDSVVLQVSDGIFTVDTTLVINRSLDIDNDIGWVMDTRWSDAVDDHAGSCGAPVVRACRDCHQSPTPGGCSAPPWIDQLPAGVGEAGNNLLCGDLAVRFPTTLPDRPTGASLPPANGGPSLHTGGTVIQFDSVPYQILDLWGGNNPACP